jgi:hypothetical protein
MTENEDMHAGVAEVVQHTWHQEPEQRPARGAVMVLMAPGGVKKCGRSFP